MLSEMSATVAESICCLRWNRRCSASISAAPLLLLLLLLEEEEEDPPLLPLPLPLLLELELELLEWPLGLCTTTPVVTCTRVAPTTGVLLS